MLIAIQSSDVKFTFTRPNGTKVDFIASSLADYMLSTGDFSDPESRLPFSDKDLAALDTVISKNKLGKESVLRAKLSPIRYKEIHFKRDALCGEYSNNMYCHITTLYILSYTSTGLERLAGEVVTDMGLVIESEDADNGQMLLVMSLFPSFSDLYCQIHQEDAEFATMVSCKVYNLSLS